MNSDEKITYLVRREQSFLSSLKQKLYDALTPSAPLPQPRIVPDIEHLPLLERVTETLRYSILSLEYILSPRGGLRQWLKINISFLLLLGIPILLFAPLLTFFMVKFTSITAYLFKSILNISLSIFALITTGSLIWGTYKLIIFLRYTEKGVRKKREQEYQQVEREVQQKREEELQRLEVESRKRREEEYRRIEVDIQKRREEEHRRIESEIRQRRKEEHQRIDSELQRKQETAQQQIEKESERRQKEEQQKFEAEVQRAIKEEQQKIIRETQQKIQIWKNNLHIYDQLCESPIERQFWEIAKHHLLGLIPQYEIGRYRADFALPDENIVIELDGHDYHKTKEQRTSDSKREKYLQERGWYIIRFTGTEIYQNVEKCVEQVAKICQNVI